MLFKRFPESRLSKLFNGSIPIVLDSLKQHYFIDRDGEMFRHILNYMRNGRLTLPREFNSYDLLLEEAKYFEIPGLMKELEEEKRCSEESVTLRTSKLSQSIGLYKSGSRNISCISKNNLKNVYETKCKNSAGITSENNFEVIALSISPDLGERIMVSGDRSLIEEIFPEVSQSMMDGRTSLPWNLDPKFVIRFPLNGYCKFNSMQAVQRLLNFSFDIVASNGGGVEGQQFSEYLFCRSTFSL
ncbi:BTB/POZ domain-containing protein kctd15-like [Armadillidium nasatum]|uniref:BTB/POZ domain-containing protein kctd15-like n=1 Tax=Armadillidium nasatum TaxID=96803 RepID=A0A5N5TJ80_9CRUS|nr:BTB/POZ domain-containing protein kctd15-like [Armadillidium nasatum]